MKTLFLSALTGLALLSASAIHAADPPPVQTQTGETGKGAKGGKRAEMKQKFEEMKTNLGLTDDQSKKIQEIMMAQKEKMKAVKDDTTLTKEQKMAKMKEGRAEVDAKISAVLTPEQKTKWDQMKKDRPAKPAAQ